MTAKSSSPARAPSERHSPGVANRLLAALSDDDRQRIMSGMDVVPLALKQTLHKPGDVVKHVYFPGGGFCSIMTMLEDGDMVEVATIGREGMVGISAVRLRGTATATAMVQAETHLSYRMKAEAFREELGRGGAFSDLIAHYLQALMGFVMQSTACNAVHSVEQRLARWLLMAQDRIESQDFPLTQEFVAMMLGATRPTVTLVAGTLQKAGLIHYHRGHMTIVDRQGLEAISCECYRAATELLRSVTDGARR